MLSCKIYAEALIYNLEVSGTKKIIQIIRTPFWFNWKSSCGLPLSWHFELYFFNKKILSDFSQLLLDSYMTFRKITNLFKLKPFQRILLRHKEDYIIPIQVYVKSQTNFVSLRINSIIISKNEFMNKTNCSWAEKWQVRKNYLCEPVDIKFLISQTSPYCSGSSVFLCDFTFNKNLRSLQYIKYLYLRLQLSMFFYYPRYAIVSTSLGSCRQMGDWIGPSLLYS